MSHHQAACLRLEFAARSRGKPLRCQKVFAEAVAEVWNEVVVPTIPSLTEVEVSVEEQVFVERSRGATAAEPIAAREHAAQTDE